MGKLERIKLEDSYKIVRENIFSCRTQNIKIENFMYYHNTDYDLMEDVLKYGLLSKVEKSKITGIELTEHDLFMATDEHYVNGKDNISLSKDINDAYYNEDIYDHKQPSQLDILISNEVKAHRSTYNYANEYLASNSIPVSFFRSIDSRLLSILECKTNYESKEERLTKIIKYYNYLLEIAKTMINENVTIPLREVSEEEVTLDKTKVIELPHIVLK